MKKIIAILPLYNAFIQESISGARRKKNGEKIKPSTITNYKSVYKNLIQFSEKSGFEIRLCDASRLTAREHKSEKRYWKKFYVQFTNYLYKNGGHDNYVGYNIKYFVAFFNYLKKEKDFDTGNFQTLFYVRKEQVPILVLNVEQLRFLIHNDTFNTSLTPNQQKVKDIFVFGCFTGLRFSDIIKLTNKNFEEIEGILYLKVKSQKTKTYSLMRLSEHAAFVYKKYSDTSAKTACFNFISLFNFNKNLKKIGELAGWDNEVVKCREILGKEKTLFRNGDDSEYRFFDLMSSHMMRRTAITTMLILGMPENLVRNVKACKLPIYS
jgi:site-specific recombinase XerD